MEELLKVENLKLSFNGPRGRVPALKGVSLSVDKGETVAIVGESGSGKTALCRCILMLHSAHAVIEDGGIDLCGHRVTEMGEDDLTKIRGKDAAMVFQDPSSSLNPVFTIGSQIMEPLTRHLGLSRSQARHRALELLEEVGIDRPEVRMKQYPHQLSGGQKQRVAIAMALAPDPSLLIADEPTTALDQETQDKIMDLLAAICRKGDRGVVFVTHDLSLAERLADRILVMKDGLVVEERAALDVFNHPSHDYTRQLVRYASYGKSGSHHHGKMPEAISESNTAPNSSNGSEDIMIRIRGLNKSFKLRGGRTLTVLDNFDLDIRRGEILGLVGPSGCGKSTLARCIMGLYAPDKGTIQVKDGCRTHMIFQDSVSAFDARMTLADIIAEPLVIGRGLPSSLKGIRREVSAVLSSGHLPEACESSTATDPLLQKVFDAATQAELPLELLSRHPYHVSGGERQRAAIARALITDPDIIIADEPISSLDVSIQAQIVHLLRKLADERDLTMLIIAHDLPMVLHISDRVLQM